MLVSSFSNAEQPRRLLRCDVVNHSFLHTMKKNTTHLAMLSFVSTMPYHFRILREHPAPHQRPYQHKNISSQITVSPMPRANAATVSSGHAPFPTRTTLSLTTLQLILLPQLSAELVQIVLQRPASSQTFWPHVCAYFLSARQTARSAGWIKDPIETRINEDTRLV